MSTKSAHWEQFSAYRPMIEDAKHQERAAILAFLEEERKIATKILSKEDCSSDCYKCDLIGGSTLKLVNRLTAFLNGE